MIKHTSALSTHYDTQAADYDSYNDAHSVKMNEAIEKVLKAHNVCSVLDVACGTGSQVLYLAQRGYHVTGSDISPAMLSIAEKKAAHLRHKIALHHADMCTVQIGTFDAVLSIFNAIGHLTRADFSRALVQISKNLTPGGLYLFDILNADALRDGDAITKLTIDWQEQTDDGTIRKIQYSTLDATGILASYTIYHEQRQGTDPVSTNHVQTLQLYTPLELKQTLFEHGFEVVSCKSVQYHSSEQERLFVTARKH